MSVLLLLLASVVWIGFAASDVDTFGQTRFWNHSRGYNTMPISRVAVRRGRVIYSTSFYANEQMKLMVPGAVYWKTEWKRDEHAATLPPWWSLPVKEAIPQSSWCRYSGGVAGLWVFANRDPSSGRINNIETAVPLWLLMVPGAIVLVRWWLREKPETFGCRACGYDLRATPGRCPECGLDVAR